MGAPNAEQQAEALALIDAERPDPGPDLSQYMAQQPAHEPAPAPAAPPDPMAAARSAPGSLMNGGEGSPQVLPPPPDVNAPAPEPRYHVEQVPSSTTTTSGGSSGLDPKAVKRILAAHEKVGEAVAGAIEAGAPQRARDAAAATEVAELSKKRAELYAQATVEAANRRDEMVRQQKEKLAELDQQGNDYLQAGDKIDSSRVWHRMDTGQKVAFAISAAMSGFAQGLNGRGGNPVLEMLTAAQERDLRAQEIGLQAKARGLQIRESAYQHFVDMGNAEEVARAKILLMSDDTVAKQIAASQASANTPTAQEAAAKLSADWAVKQAQDTVALEQTVARHTTSGGTSRTTQAMLVDENGRPVTKQTKDDQAEATVDNLTSIPGVVVRNRALAKNSEMNRSLQKPMLDQLQGVQQIHTAAKIMQDLSTKYGTTYGVTAEGAQAKEEFDTAKKSLTAGLRNSLGEHATDAQIAAMDSLVNMDLSDWFQTRTRAKVKGLVNTATKEVNGRYVATGLGFDAADWERRQNADSGGGIVRQVQ